MKLIKEWRYLGGVGGRFGVAFTRPELMVCVIQVGGSTYVDLSARYLSVSR